MTHPDPAFSAELVAALQSDTPALDESARTRIRDKLALSIGLAPPAAPESGVEQLASATTAAAKSSTTLLAIGFAIGTGVGAAGHALVASPAVQVVYRDRVIEVAAPPAAPPAPALGVEKTPAPPAEPRAAARSAAALAPSAESASAAHVDDGLSVELGLLDQARKSLGGGNALRALETLEAHAGRYPKSRLEQEREALRVKALIGAGRHAEARAQGERFRQRFPKSMLLDSVEKALGSIP